MKLALAYMVMPGLGSDSIKQVESSISSIRRLKFAQQADRFALCASPADCGVLERLAGGFSVEHEDLSAHSGENFGCRQLSMLSAFNARHKEYDIAVSIPSNWYLRGEMDITSAVSMVSRNHVAFSIFLGGNPCAHVDRDCLFMTFGSPFAGYLRLACRSYDVPGLDRLDCPSIVRFDRVLNLYNFKNMRLNDINRCGWDPSVDLVLYPDKLKCRWDDDKPEPFVDMVGIAPDLWDPVEIDKEG